MVGILRGRPNADAPGQGHCDVVLAVDAALKDGRRLIATGGQTGDGALKIWLHVEMDTPGPTSGQQQQQQQVEGGTTAVTAAAMDTS